MAKRATELEEQAVRLSAGMFAAIPKLYLDKPDPSDRVCRAWRDAVEASIRASLMVERLGDLLRGKAGITEPGPTAVLKAEILEMEEEAKA